MNSDQHREHMLPSFTEDDREQQLIERYRQRQAIQRRSAPAAMRPEHEPGDIRRWWGGRYESPALQRHHARMDGIYYAARQAAYTQESAMALEFYSFATTLRTLAAEQQELRTTNPNTLIGEVAEQMFLDSAERLRAASTEIQEDFRRKVLGS